MPRHATWHCINQKAAPCCFISSVVAMFSHFGDCRVTRALESLEARLTDVLASTSLRRGQRRHLEAWSIGGSLHDTETRSTTASAVGHYNWWTGAWASHGTETCTGGSSVARHGTLHSIRSGTTIFCTVGYLAPCQPVALNIASHRTSRAALRNCTQTELRPTFYWLLRITFNWHSAST